MTRSFTRGKIIALAIAGLAGLGLPALGRADDRDLLFAKRQAAPNVLIILDSSGSMNDDFTDSYNYAAWMDDPRSKMQTAKQVLKTVLPQIEATTPINFGFTTYQSGTATSRFIKDTGGTEPKRERRRRPETVALHGRHEDGRQREPVVRIDDGHEGTRVRGASAVRRAHAVRRRDLHGHQRRHVGERRSQLPGRANGFPTVLFELRLHGDRHGQLPRQRDGDQLHGLERDEYVLVPRLRLEHVVQIPDVAEEPERQRHAPDRLRQVPDGSHVRQEDRRPGDRGLRRFSDPGPRGRQALSLHPDLRVGFDLHDLRFFRDVGPVEDLRHEVQRGHGFGGSELGRELLRGIRPDQLELQPLRRVERRSLQPLSDRAHPDDAERARARRSRSSRSRPTATTTTCRRPISTSTAPRTRRAGASARSSAARRPS